MTTEQFEELRVELAAANVKVEILYHLTMELNCSLESRAKIAR